MALQQQHSLERETPFCAHLGFPIYPSSSLIFLSSKVYILRIMVQHSTQLGEAVVARLISDCVEIIFDVNLENSLKSQTRKERGTGILQKVVVEA
jgi:hypothetical protein